MRKLALVCLAWVWMGCGVACPQESVSSEPPRFFAVLETSVKPGWVPVFETSHTDLKDMREELHIGTLAGPIISLNESPLYFQIFLPMQGLGDMERMRTEFQPRNDEEWNARLGKMKIARNYEKWWIVKERPDLSYQPGSDSLRFTDESLYMNFTFFYGCSDLEKEIDETFKEWIELYRSNEIPYGYTVYETIIGDECPLLIFVYTASNAAEFFLHQQEIAQKLVYKEAKMMEKALKLCRKYEVHTGYYRPELTDWKNWGK